nr:DUF6726 family protein [Paraburkholderia adhaesiva]
MEAALPRRITRLRFGLKSYLPRVVPAIALAFVTMPLDGCAVAAFPCRIASATLKIVPVVGHATAVPFDACAAAID